MPVPERPLRVLFWSDLYLPYIGGAEVFASRLMAALRPRGVEFLVITSHHDRELPDESLEDGVPVRRLPFRAAIEGRDVKAFVRALKETAAMKRAFAPDLIHMNGIGPSALFHLRTAEASTAPLLVTLQQEVLQSQSGGASTMLASVVDSAQWIVGCSQAVLDQARAAHPSIADRSSRIYNGVDAPPLEPSPLPRDPHVLALGRLVPAKGFDIALRAFALLAARFPSARFTVAGDGVSRDELHALARDLGIAGRVRFPGWIEPNDVPALLDQVSVVVMPSRREGLPIVAVQAALMARPIVATAVGGLPEIVIDGETGIRIPGEDAEALAREVGRLLSDSADAAAIGARARHRALTTFAWERTVASYHARYIALAETTP